MHGAGLRGGQVPQVELLLPGRGAVHHGRHGRVPRVPGHVAPRHAGQRHQQRDHVQVGGGELAQVEDAGAGHGEGEGLGVDRVRVPVEAEGDGQPEHAAQAGEARHQEAVQQHHLQPPRAPALAWVPAHSRVVSRGHRDNK